MNKKGAIYTDHQMELLPVKLITAMQLNFILTKTSLWSPL